AAVQRSRAVRAPERRRLRVVQRPPEVQVELLARVVDRTDARDRGRARIALLGGVPTAAGQAQYRNGRHRADRAGATDHADPAGVSASRRTTATNSSGSNGLVR